VGACCNCLMRELTAVFFTELIKVKYEKATIIINCSLTLQEKIVCVKTHLLGKSDVFDIENFSYANS
jgi:hypothetical protein